MENEALQGKLLLLDRADQLGIEIGPRSYVMADVKYTVASWPRVYREIYQRSQMDEVNRVILNVLGRL